MGITVKNGEIIRGNAPVSKNQEEAIKGYEEAMKDVKPFGVKAEEEMRAYEAAHPKAVRDVEKARVMAEAGDELETRAAKRGQRAIEQVRRLVEIGGDTEFPPSEGVINDLMSDARSQMNISYMLREEALKKEEEAGKRYDEQN